jgi:hypothetical protein
LVVVPVSRCPMTAPGISGAIARSARARRTYDRIMGDSP